SGMSSSSGNLGSGRDTLTVGKISSSGNHITSSGNALAFYSQQRPIRRIHQGRYGVSVPTLTKDHEGNKFNMPYP
ncbi:hypothetical protein Tco_0244653, partial [Tanacetum coccineum]